jgi:hypothetical protein
MTNFEKWKNSLTLEVAASYIEKIRQGCRDCLVEQYCMNLMRLNFKKHSRGNCRSMIIRWLKGESDENKS